MDKLQECVNLKYKINNKELHNKFGIPMRTIQVWDKREEGNWRNELVCNLRMQVFLENIAKQKIKKLFKNNELKALAASLTSTLIGEEFYTIQDVFSLHFKDTCLYEPMLVQQFLEEGQDFDIFCNAVCKKLQELCPFEKYVLINMLREVF